MSTIRSAGIIDYGAGNLSSVANALKRLDVEARITKSAEDLEECEALILPGVGAFPTAMKNLDALNLVGYLRNAAQEGRSIIGICLGMQLLAEMSEEIKETSGLGLLPGWVRQMKSRKTHIGWNNIEVTMEDDTLRKSDGDIFYFNHSYTYMGSEEYTTSIARVDAAGPKITASVKRGSVQGVQFHPEKSQLAGLKLLKAMLEIQT